jgi:hypothetical protein
MSAAISVFLILGGFGEQFGVVAPECLGPIRRKPAKRVVRIPVMAFPLRFQFYAGWSRLVSTLIEIR